MKELTFIRVPGWHGWTDVDDIVNVVIKERSLMIACYSRSGMYEELTLLRGDYMPEYIKDASSDDYIPHMSLCGTDFVKYKAMLESNFKIIYIDPLEEPSCGNCLFRTKSGRCVAKDSPLLGATVSKGSETCICYYRNKKSV